MKFFFIPIFLFSSSLFAFSATDRALCGYKPINASREYSAMLSRQEIERNMPPVSDQSPASWCYAFSSTALIDYHQFQSQNVIRDPELFYRAETMLSPIDAVSMHNNYCRHPDVGLMDSQKGGTGFPLFLGVQSDEYRARSVQQIPFDSLNDSNPRAVKLLEELVKEYEEVGGGTCSTYYSVAGVKCPSPLYESSLFEEQIESMRLINEWIYDTAEFNGLLKSPFKVQNYTSIAALKGEPDLQLAPFTTNRYVGSNLMTFFKNMGGALYPEKGSGVPIQTSICSEDLVAESVDISSTSCGGHVVVVTGAYYKDGECVVRIRNSWGDDWEDGGYITVDVDHFIRMQQHYNRASGNEHSYQMNWLTNQESDESPVKIYSDSEIYSGSYRQDYSSATSYTAHKMVGITRDLSGKFTAVAGQNFGGGFFTGDVTDMGKGNWTPRQGRVRDASGNMIYAYEIKLSSGLSYTGSTVSTADGSWSTKSGLAKNSDGRVVKAFHYPIEEGVVFNGSIVQRQNGDLERESGLDYRDGKMVYAYNYKLDSGTIYTGPVRDNGNGTFTTMR